MTLEFAIFLFFATKVLLFNRSPNRTNRANLGTHKDWGHYVCVLQWIKPRAP
jgi:hypothetical protein